jgi:hypothetical protein
MAIEADIGALLFRDILKIYQYPGSPFTGNIINDLISYFFIPMVFVIFFIYMLLGRITAGAQWMRFLMGIAIFLFMIVNGWFAMFALMAGPYFVFLIVVLGALYFIPSHFRIGGIGGGGRATIMPAGVMTEQDKTRRELTERLARIRARIKNLETRGEGREALVALYKEEKDIEEELIKRKLIREPY